MRKPWWSPVASPASPSPTPQNPHHRQAVDSKTRRNFNNSKGRSKKKAKDQSEAKVQTNTTVGACCGNQLTAKASARAWRFPEQTAMAVDLRQHQRRQLLRRNGRKKAADTPLIGLFRFFWSGYHVPIR